MSITNGINITHTGTHGTYISLYNCKVTKGTLSHAIKPNDQNNILIYGTNSWIEGFKAVQSHFENCFLALDTTPNYSACTFGGNFIWCRISSGELEFTQYLAGKFLNIVSGGATIIRANMASNVDIDAASIEVLRAGGLATTTNITFVITNWNFTFHRMVASLPVSGDYVGQMLIINTGGDVGKLYVWSGAAWIEK